MNNLSPVQGPQPQITQSNGGMAPPNMVPYAHGIVKMVGIAQMLKDERLASEEAQNHPMIQGLAAHVRQAWMWARTAKQSTI